MQLINSCYNHLLTFLLSDENKDCIALSSITSSDASDGFSVDGQVTDMKVERLQLRSSMRLQQEQSVLDQEEIRRLETQISEMSKVKENLEKRMNILVLHQNLYLTETI